ncbi:hypothetical protein NDU88_002956 [Pleurodeles waltl]|uniref:Uncharacterized protein n=1 Tax=Pleurodeles waltl TaxID=8319 RepID=A0AAV7M4V1_PLEWA|nr:hypothetical protein NDU88_002956 [Pleurodeles waltl]
MPLGAPGLLSWVRQAPGGTFGDGFPDPEVLCASPDGTDRDESTGLFKGPHHTGETATTGRGRFWEPGNGIA